MLRHALPIIPLSLGLVASTAHAQPAFAPPAATAPVSPVIVEDAPPTPAVDPEHAPAVRVDLGLFSPVGELGVVYSRPVHRYAAIELGAGLGFSGVQLSAMSKLRAGGERTKFTPGVGLSVGLPVFGSALHAGHPGGDRDATGSAVTMAWLDVDLLGIEHRTRSGMVLSASAGLTFALTRGHWDAADIGDDLEPFDVLPQARFGLGKTF